MSKSEEKGISRRTYLQVAGGTVAGLIVGGALGYVAKPTATGPPETVTSTVTQAVTQTVTGAAPGTTTAASAGGGTINILSWETLIDDMYKQLIASDFTPKPASQLTIRLLRGAIT